MLRAKHKRLIIISLLLIAILAFGMLIYKSHNHPEAVGPADSSSLLGNDIKRSTDLSSQYLKSFGTNHNPVGGSETDIKGISVAWVDERPVDGNYTCTVFESAGKLILATYLIPGGLSLEERPSEITYRTNTISNEQIDNIIANYCKTGS